MFYPLKVNGNKMSIHNSEIEKITFKDLGLKENVIEEFLASNLELWKKMRIY